MDLATLDERLCAQDLPDRPAQEEGDIGGLEDDRTIGQLTSIRYRHNSRGQVVIEGKEEARKRGVRSPDRAEALMLCFARDDGFAAMTFGR